MTSENKSFIKNLKTKRSTPNLALNIIELTCHSHRFSFDECYLDFSAKFYSQESHKHVLMICILDNK